ncbi:uncharacterized protein LOC131220189 [Magnolia sinica]|uniref:uncharacterized protein LOC131220189 n=1 Tax=Magnolia sinica TaxID=86752 RepID=UPI00265B5DD5|nr:uncharacterized protein LOC131220189 [Magnolia sinica]
MHNFYGDFNATISADERRSCRSGDMASSREFAEAINTAKLIDAAFSGNRFTWSNNEGGQARVWACLDRVLHNQEWSFAFPSFHVVQDAWNAKNSTHPIFNVLLKLKKVKEALKKWNKEVFGNISVQQHNLDLMALPSLHEVHQIVLAIPADGAAGPDRFSGAFYLGCWNIIAQEAAVYVFQGGPIPQAVNVSLICLIPKSNSPSSFANFGSISLYNCLYKIIATKLSYILPSLISLEQGAFIQGRAITDHVALAPELFRDINRKSWGSNIVMKVDMENAYDKLDWGFLKKVLSQFGFSSD